MLRTVKRIWTCVTESKSDNSPSIKTNKHENEVVYNDLYTINESGWAINAQYNVKVEWRCNRMVKSFIKFGIGKTSWLYRLENTYYE